MKSTRSSTGQKIKDHGSKSDLVNDKTTVGVARHETLASALALIQKDGKRFGCGGVFHDKINKTTENKTHLRDCDAMVWPWYRLEIVFAQLPTAKWTCLWRLNGHHTDDDGGGNDDTDDATAAT